MRSKLYSIFYCSLFLVFYAWRWVSLDNELPASWTPESMIGYTATVWERPEYTDAKTIIRDGIWYISITGYAEIIPGDTVRFVGKVERKVLGSKELRIVMMDPTFEVISHTRCVSEFHAGCVLSRIGEWREKWVRILEKVMPSPMSSLGAGILLGIKGQMPYDFYQQLIATGTLHIVAASGFNVMIVAQILMNLALNFFRRGVAIGIGVGGIVLYVLLAGASASVVRAGIMGSLSLMAYFWGRPSEAKRLLWVTAGIMMLSEPRMVADIGFQLSVAATAGLIYMGPRLQILKARILRFSNEGVEKFIEQYLFPTLAASLATAPIILWHFGRVSLISPLVNLLILPVVPLIMFLTAMVVILGSVAMSLAYLAGWVAYVPLAWVVWVVKLFG